jgi:hypothetical protein
MVALILGMLVGSVVWAAIYVALMHRVAHAGRQ